MLHISHRQTTAYHPESNGAVKRLHRCLKDALRARAAAATWSEELPFVLFGLRAQPREDTGLSPTEAVFGAPIVLPNEEMLVDAIIKNFSKTLHVPAVSLPRHNSSTQLPDELPGDLLSAPLVWVRRGGVIHPTPSAALRRPLHRPAPRAPLLHHPSRVLGRGHRRQPPQGLHGRGRHAWQPASPRQAAGFAPRQPCHNRAGLIFRPAGFSTFPSGAATRRSQNRFPTRRGGFCMPGTGSALTGATDKVPVSSTGTAKEVGPLISSPSSRGQSSGGALWTPAYIPSYGQTSRMYSSNPGRYMYSACI
jgi:hypothetical protein